MPDQHRRTAGRAELAVAVLGLLVEAELVRAFRHLDVWRRPQARRVDWRAEPATARATVAVHLNRRVASDFELDRAARAAGPECVRHGIISSTVPAPTQPSSVGQRRENAPRTFRRRCPDAWGSPGQGRSNVGSKRSWRRRGSSAENAVTALAAHVRPLHRTPLTAVP